MSLTDTNKDLPKNTEAYKKPKERTHYVDNKKLYTEMIVYLNKLNEAKEQGLKDKDLPRIPEYVGKTIYLIATRLATKPNFAGYSYKDEMISDGIYITLTQTSQKIHLLTLQQSSIMHFSDEFSVSRSNSTSSKRVLLTHLL